VALGAEEAALSPSNLEGHAEAVGEESIRNIQQLGEGGTTMKALADFVHLLSFVNSRK
jgi:hypothetical protein